MIVLFEQAGWRYTRGVKDNYRRIGSWYDKLAALYSFGRISICRRAFIEEISYGERYLFIGVGQGAEAIEVAQKGGRVTVVDCSEKMLMRFQKLVERSEDGIKYPVEAYLTDVLEWESEDSYDRVICNFFLNVFHREEMRAMLPVIAKFMAKKGRLIISDFLVEKERTWLIKIIQKLNWYTALCVFRIFAKNAFHSVHDYFPAAEENELALTNEKKYGVLGIKLYHAIEFGKSEGGKRR